MYAGTVYEVFILPITFKTVSFHHRANYAIKFIPAQTHPSKSVAIRPDSSVSLKRTDSRTGNIMGVGASVTREGTLTTERFQIDYNEQSVNFTTGLWLNVTLLKEQKILPIKIEMYRIDVAETKDGVVRPIQNPKQKKVAEELLNITLQQSKEALTGQYHYRKLIFPTCEYISFIDVGCISIKMGQKIDFSKIYYDDVHNELFIEENTMIHCCLAQRRIVDPESFLREIYNVSIRDKLKAYEEVSSILKEKIKQFKAKAHSKKFTLNVTKKWQQKWIRSEIPNLRFLDMSSSSVNNEQLLQSCLPIRQESYSQFSYILSHHYDCYAHQLSGRLAQESFLIDLNIQAIFQRIIQILATLGGGAAAEIAINEKKRVADFLSVSQEGKKYSFEEGISKDNFEQYQGKVNQLLMELPNFSILQENQPLLMISGDNPIGTEIDKAKTVTILVHGFRGNQFDLSKLKSYLNLFLGFTHFYAVKSIATGQGTNASISKLGELAGEEVNKYLDTHTGIKYVNVIGFSLGGVIARSMLTHLKGHQTKFNLLLTLASPHLGMQEVQSCLVKMGLFYMNRVAKVQSIQDLNNEHTTDRSRFLHELANCRMITSFRWVILVGSSQDDYVPSYSSLCNYNGDNEVIRQLSRCFNSQVGVIRCNVKINVDESLMDKLTRRRVHISLLEDDSFIRMLVVRFQHYFTHTR